METNAKNNRGGSLSKRRKERREVNGRIDRESIANRREETDREKPTKKGKRKTYRTRGNWSISRKQTQKEKDGRKR